MQAKLIGFVGIEKYDIIYYLASVISALNKSVLVVDSSDEESLKTTIPTIFLEENDVFHYKNMDVVLDPKTTSVDFNSYDYVLIDFGFDVKNKTLITMNEIYMVTDLQMHHAHEFKDLELGLYQERFLIVRDSLKYKSIDRYILQEFDSKSIGLHNSFALRLDEQDKLRMLDCMYNDSFKFNDISSSFQNLLYAILSPDVSEKEFLKAFKIASRGGKK